MTDLNEKNDMEIEQKPKKKGGNKLLYFSLFLIFISLACIGGFGYYAFSFLNSPASEVSREVEFVIQPNSTFTAISKELKKNNLVTNDRLLILLASYNKQAEKIKSGRYLLNTNWTPNQLLDHLVNGMPILDRITIPEGLTWWQTAKRLESAGFGKYEDFKAVISDPEFLKHYGIEAKTAEGYLFPDTYFIMRPLVQNKKSARVILGRLVDNFWRRTASVWQSTHMPPKSVRIKAHDILTASSIVEKETSVPAERTRIAGVFANRLRIGMPLQADPTIIYGIGPEFDGDIKRSDLRNADNKYNTYKHKGLPPGPICSPGIEAIRAAISPENHKFLYFVARGDGSHTFSTNLAAHNRAVRMYLRSKKK